MELVLNITQLTAEAMTSVNRWLKGHLFAGDFYYRATMVTTLVH